MLDRRKTSQQTIDRRIKNRVYSQFNIITFVNGKKFETTARNLSSTGIQIIEPRKSNLNIYQNYRICISYDKTSQTIELDARVIWKNFGFIGLSFQNMDGTIKEKLHHLLTMVLMESVATNGMAAFG